MRRSECSAVTGSAGSAHLAGPTGSAAPTAPAGLATTGSANSPAANGNIYTSRPMSPRAALIAGIKQATDRRRNDLLLGSPRQSLAANLPRASSPLSFGAFSPAQGPAQGGPGAGLNHLHPPGAGPYWSASTTAGGAHSDYLSPPRSPSPMVQSDLVPPRPDFYGSAFDNGSQFKRPLSPNSLPARPLSSSSDRVEVRKSWLFDQSAPPSARGHRRASSMSSSLSSGDVLKTASEFRDVGVIGSPVKQAAKVSQ